MFIYFLYFELGLFAAVINNFGRRYLKARWWTCAAAWTDVNTSSAKYYDIQKIFVIVKTNRVKNNYKLAEKKNLMMIDKISIQILIWQNSSMSKSK